MKTTKFLIALIGLTAMLSFAKADAKSVNHAVAVVENTAVSFQPGLPPPPPRPRLPFIRFHHRGYRHHVYHHRRYHRY